MASPLSPGFRRHGQDARGRQDDLASETIDPIARLHRDHAVAARARDQETRSDAPGVQAAIVQPAQLAMRTLQLGEIAPPQKLAVEEYDPLNLGDMGVSAHP